jgi:hypothetical protein
MHFLRNVNQTVLFLTLVSNFICFSVLVLVRGSITMEFSYFAFK